MRVHLIVEIEKENVGVNFLVDYLGERLAKKVVGVALPMGGLGIELGWVLVLFFDVSGFEVFVFEIRGSEVFDGVFERSVSKLLHQLILKLPTHLLLHPKQPLQPLLQILHTLINPIEILSILLHLQVILQLCLK